MSNKKQFKDNLYARIRIRPLVHYANLDKFLDEEWTIGEITERSFTVRNPNGYSVIIGHDARREWMDDFSKQDGCRRGTIMLEAQIILRDGNSRTEPIDPNLYT